MTFHRGILRRTARPAQVARLRAAGHELEAGPCGLCGSSVLYSPAERLEDTTLVCPRCLDDVLTSNARQGSLMAVGLPPGYSAGVLVQHDPGCPAPRGGDCGGGCEPDVSLVLGEGGR